MIKLLSGTDEVIQSALVDFPGYYRITDVIKKNGASIVDIWLYRSYVGPTFGSSCISFVNITFKYRRKRYYMAIEAAQYASEGDGPSISDFFRYENPKMIDDVIVLFGGEAGNVLPPVAVKFLNHREWYHHEDNWLELHGEYKRLGLDSDKTRLVELKQERYELSGYEWHQMLREQARESMADAFECDYYDGGEEYDSFDWRD